MKAIVIDDETKGRDLMYSLIQNYCPEIQILALASNAEEAYDLINLHAPDVVFLDIEMPDGDGFYLLQKFETINFQVIFTTAYDHYAIKALKFHALDYLLKPIDIDELRLAVENLKKIEKKDQNPNKYADFISSRKLEAASKIALPVKDGIVYVTISDIIRIESDGSYSTFYITDKKRYVISKNLKEYENILPANDFFRAHKSHLINIKKVERYIRTDGCYVEMQGGAIVEISRRKRDEFLKVMNQFSLVNP